MTTDGESEGSDAELERRRRKRVPPYLRHIALNAAAAPLQEERILSGAARRELVSQLVATGAVKSDGESAGQCMTPCRCTLSHQPRVRCPRTTAAFTRKELECKRMSASQQEMLRTGTLPKCKTCGAWFRDDASLEPHLLEHYTGRTPSVSELTAQLPWYRHWRLQQMRARRPDGAWRAVPCPPRADAVWRALRLLTFAPLFSCTFCRRRGRWC